MAALTRTLKIGVIAEERNDIEVLYELTSKIIPETSFSFKQFIGHGCGTLRRKCHAWANNLKQRGCSFLVVLHDLDKRDESELRAALEGEIEDQGFHQSVVLIPIEEIEAWLLCDPRAIKTVFRMRDLPTIPSQPECISNPKEFLSDLVTRNSKSHYLNTIHNQKVAAELALDLLKKRCPSFSHYPQFLYRARKGS
jgi:hypothetical protein